ncbi:MAG: hypothetical protein OXU45_07465 [Candidatus Melainabacteria bacterium]|nr:hypothetical protein [Candidatus Melainabacteria bacterium]
MTKKDDSHHEIHRKLSDLTDQEPNIYELTKDLARIAKQIKEDTKEDPEPPKPILEAIYKFSESTAA